MLRRQKKFNDELTEMMRKNQSDRIDLMDEGEKRELAKIDDQYNNEIASIEKKMSEWREAQNGQLTSGQTQVYDESYQIAFDKRTNAEAEFHKKRDKAAQVSWNEYLKEFGEHEEKILAINELYNEKIAEAKTEGEKASLDAQRQRAISELSSEMMKKTSLWTKFFKDIEKQGKASIAQTIKQLELLIAYGRGDIKALPEDLKEVFGSLNDGSEKSNELLEKLDEGLDNVRETSKKLESTNPFKNIASGFKDFKSAAKGSEGEMKSLQQILSGFQEVGSIFSELGNAMEDAGMKAGKVVVTIGDVISKTISMAGAGASVGGGWGAVVGAVLGAASALIPALVSTGGMSEETSHYYETLISVTDELIDKQLELVSVSTGAAAAASAANAATMAEYNKMVNRDALSAYIGSRKSGQHSVGVQTKERLQTLFRGYYKEAYMYIDELFKGHLYIQDKFLDTSKLREYGIEVGDIYKDVTNTLLSYSGEQLEALKTYGMAVWATLDEETQEYLNGVIAADNYLKEIRRVTMESYTGATQDSISDSMSQLFSDADLTFEEIGASFEDHMKKAILNVVNKGYMDELTAWYEAFAEDMKDGTLDDAELLREWWKKIAEGGNETLKNAMAAAGIDFEGVTSATASPLAGAIKGASQEEVNALIGYMNNTMINQSEETDLIRDQMRILTSIDGKIAVSNQFLESIDGKLTSKSDPLRAQGIQ
jgi:hypothetical protein